MNDAVRAFFDARGYLEVETPIAVVSPGLEPHLEAFATDEIGPDRRASRLWLHTSPEYAMKKMLGRGLGSIYQLARVFRNGERSRTHAPEFTMLEWYRLGFSLDDLMNEVAALVRTLLGDGGDTLPVEFVSYVDALRRHADLDPFGELEPLRAAARELGLDTRHADAAGRDELLDLIVGARVGPALGRNALTFLHRYPASQAALARLDPADARLALRFELYHQGVELANGYHELASGAEQRQRFAEDLRQRAARGLPAAQLDPHLLAALDAGLPDCAGVALGFDRVLMLATRATNIDEVLAFPVERA